MIRGAPRLDANGNPRVGGRALEGYSTLDKDNKPVWEPGLPAQCISRREHRGKQEEVPVVLDLKHALRIAPEARADWLTRALKLILTNKTKAQDVFNVVTHPKFVSGLTERNGQRLYRTVMEHSALQSFSEKQKATLIASCKLATLYGPRGTHDAVSDPASSDEESRRRHESVRSCETTRQDEVAQTKCADALQDETHRLIGRVEDPHDKEALELALQERQRLIEEERQRTDAERRAQEAREQQRKQRLGCAFVTGEEADEDDTLREEKKRRDAKAAAEAALRPEGSKGGQASASSWVVDAMGGNNVLRDAFGILSKAAGDNQMKKGKRESRSRSERRRSRSRRKRRRSRSARRSLRRSRSRSQGRANRRPPLDRGSLRSPTPDGHLRGQMRRARKAKMMANILGLQQPGHR
jgi:hypothetical protein